ncbi:NAD(P)-dependent dehydrogenase (short-subunit alcohol dehydrogenase family) [Catenuloplanes nepalensis]|uniref:NAD(P)-dependent dehydrogenase (Short-subunit alcohol dehydrogenase family) n=1 Tax=Catenuloplanes nepalensis TaxID=587533 RepID=A0ABT9MVG7_9ACTN|nr:hypothetical protein [Catenuloplanes nepalensis]MDP9795430.1 NAD(P)-dependent dehydrogenase (short-subunit alcohol dehydrogenase family) [Catenuloplanes nepalensis]
MFDRAATATTAAVSSRAHLRSAVVFEDVHYRARPYDAGEAHGQSKTANVLFAVEAAARWARDGIDVNALDSGSGGTATSVLLAASPAVKGVTGRYFEDRAEAGPHAPGVAAWALDVAAAARLWELSVRTLR